MAITPTGNATLDPNNTNRVVLGAPDTFGLSPNPQPPTPQPSPVPTTTVNVNPAPEAPTTGSTTPTQTGTATPTQPQQPAQMPANGSVVDLLNGLGVNSSKENRSALAQQFGVKDYDFSAGKNTELAKKYLDFYNANKDTKVPDTAAEATSAIEKGLAEQNQTKEDPQQSFFDSYMSMNPVVKQMYDTINQQLSSMGTTQTFAEEYKNLLAEQGIPALQTELMNINNIMDGTEDDIRTEVTKAGGFATESQVQALKAARNKTLLKQANVLQQQLQLKQDYVNQIMQFSQLDRAEVEKQVDRKLGLTGMLVDLNDKIENAAKENYKTIVDYGNELGQNGYAYLAEALGGDPTALRTAERTMGLPKGALSNPGFLAPAETEWSEPYKLGGSYVQKNAKTGEIRTAADIPSTGGGISGPTSYQEWVLAGSPGTYADYLKDSSTKAPTTAQQTVGTYAARVEQANPTITSLQENIKNMNPALFEAQRALPSYFQTADFQQFDQAARNFINAVLRRESGAVISPSEFDNAYKQYLPRSGDTQATLDQKKQNRDIIYASFKNAAGNAFQSVDELLNVLPTTPSGSYEAVYNGKTYIVDSSGNMTEKK